MPDIAAHDTDPPGMTPADAAHGRLARLAAACVDAPVGIVLLLGGPRPRAIVHGPLPAGALGALAVACSPLLTGAGTAVFCRREHPALFADVPVAFTFAAAQPVRLADGLQGAVCVLDRAERKLDAAQQAALADVAHLAADLLAPRADPPRLRSDKATARRLKVVEDRFRLLWQTTLDVVVMMDERSRIQFVNPAVASMFGHRPESLLGRDLAVLQPERMREAHRRGLQHYLASGQRRLDWRAAEAMGLHADGHEFPIEISFSDLEADGQRVFAGYIRDISVRRAAEAAQRTLAEQLRQAQKMEALGVLAGGIAHDFNNVVAGILGNAALALADSPSGPAQAHLRQIQLGGRRGRELVQQILSFARRRPLVLAASNLNDVVRESLGLLQPTWPAHARLTLALSDAPCGVQADAAQLGQVITNLCTNALHALAGQPGDVVVETSVVHPGLPGEPTAATRVRLCVTDTGGGMDEATAARIFEPFFTTKPPGHGTGLGLSVVHGIVGAHGGTIGVTSQPGRGTRFELHLPASEAPPAPGAAPDAPALACQGRGQRVLYVDDDDVMRLMTQGLIERLGYQAVVCDGVPAALALLDDRASDVALVLTDFDMPGQSGLALAERLQALRPGLPVVLTSGNVTEAMAQEASRLGVRGLVQKEDGVEALGRVLRQLLP